MMSKAKIYYHDIGDYLNREEKLAIIKKYGSVSNVPWEILSPNEHGDWLNQQNDVFNTFIPIEPEKKFEIRSNSFFAINGPGISSGRDFWVYNFSKFVITENVDKTIDFYNEQKNAYILSKQENGYLKSDDFIDNDLKKISWTVNLKNDLERGITHIHHKNNIFKGNYRPFAKHFIYYDKSLIERPGLNRIFFPNSDVNNLLLSVSGVGSSKDFSVLISDKLTSYDLLEKTQCFPLYYYEERQKSSPQSLRQYGR